MSNTGLIEARMLAMLAERSPDASICPSEVARSLATEDAAWRALMAPVREVATALAVQGSVIITQGQQQVVPEGPFKGPIRLRRGPAYQAPDSRQESDSF
jgi:hypothetical protein